MKVLNRARNGPLRAVVAALMALIGCVVLVIINCSLVAVANVISTSNPSAQVAVDNSNVPIAHTGYLEAHCDAVFEIQAAVTSVANTITTPRTTAATINTTTTDITAAATKTSATATAQNMITTINTPANMATMTGMQGGYDAILPTSATANVFANYLDNSYTANYANTADRNVSIIVANANKTTVATANNTNIGIIETTINTAKATSTATTYAQGGYDAILPTATDSIGSYIVNLTNSDIYTGNLSRTVSKGDCFGTCLVASNVTFKFAT
jgi:hypothetical protein